MFFSRLKFFIPISIITVIIAISGLLYAKEGGAPSGNTGSPGDGQTCAHTDCHAGGSTEVTGIISTDVPETGYRAGEVYTVVVIINSPGTEKFGFQASPQNLDGDLMGNIDLINASQTKLTGGGKYITHTSTGSNGDDIKTWTFTWTPEDATGDVTFYVAINIANNDEHATGDSICTSSITVTEDPANIPLEAGSSDIYADIQNPVTDVLTIQMQSASGDIINFELVDLNGVIVKRATLNPSGGERFDVSDIPAGIYFVRLEQNGNTLVKQVIKMI